MSEYHAAYKPVEEARSFHEFPKWKYHHDGRSVIIQSAEEEESLGSEWLDSKPEKAAKLPIPSNDASAKMIASLEEDNAKIKSEYNGICDKIASALTEDELLGLGEDKSGSKLADIVVNVIASLRNPEESIESLTKKAESLGVKVDKRWSVDRLKKEIDNAAK